MNAREKEILHTLSEKIKAIFPDTKIWLFGSRAKETAEPDSDYDIFVVCRDAVQRKQISEILWETGFENDMLLVGSYIEEILFSDPKYRQSMFIQSAMKDCISL
ncbi:MAG TPA: nucleotidyltransferase domain-containing protein [Leptospiraceae bacterium]|nr:nucleotidyltransferase domain-containing protein [Leptospiraceae bacterium]HNF15901.1 nucleotidyltransferase domain-containing protein [Leptospiraceae bacterium]HNF28202.1 nucleotidyltransferase domain-containing protein [Leptospiraceae bacterium]HNI99449.1 nucleotidyltransferase domain-containing protein [Leptospiraceae bacterium]HNM06663.1 nucleotidyltransferase domain-containing protein [Leptospiraceae bacterium]